jgi:hypothetical protein
VLTHVEEEIDIELRITCLVGSCRGLINMKVGGDGRYCFVNPFKEVAMSIPSLLLTVPFKDINVFFGVDNLTPKKSVMFMNILHVSCYILPHDDDDDDNNLY